MTDETVAVEQCDRDAAADYFEAIGDPARAKVARRGEYDLAAAVQHFSAYRHRIAALASAREPIAGDDDVQKRAEALFNLVHAHTVIKYDPEAGIRCCAAALAHPRPALDREAVRDDVADLLHPLHYEAWKAGVFTSQDEWPDDDEQDDLTRGIDSVAVGEHFQAWGDDVVDKLTDRILALATPPASLPGESTNP